MNGFATLGERFAGTSVWWALLLTLAVEGLIAAVWFRDGKVIWAVLLCSVVTNPLVNGLYALLVRFLPGAGWQLALQLVLEAAVVAAEALLLRAMLGWEMKKALIVSFVLNAASYLAGLLLQTLL